MNPTPPDIAVSYIDAGVNSYIIKAVPNFLEALGIVMPIN